MIVTDIAGLLHPADPPQAIDRDEALAILGTRYRTGYGPCDATDLAKWSSLPITEARRLDMPGITAIALEELQDRMASGMSYDHPAPLYRMLNKRFVREVL